MVGRVFSRLSNGTGTWLPLLTAKADGTTESHVDGFTGEEVSIYTRLAPDEAGATKMDRPEGFEPKVRHREGLTFNRQ